MSWLDLLIVLGMIAIFLLWTLHINHNLKRNGFDEYYSDEPSMAGNSDVRGNIIDVEEQMDIREEASLKYGAVKLFLLPKEIALLSACLSWVNIELQLANDDINRLSDSSTVVELKAQIPMNTFNNVIPIVESTHDSIRTQSLWHYEERNDAVGHQKLLEEMNKFEVRFGEVQRLKSLLTVKLYRDITNQDSN